MSGPRWGGVPVPRASLSVLDEFANSSGLTDTPQSRARREKAMNTLRACVRDWALGSNAASAAPSDTGAERARLLVYGSCRLGVPSPSSDIDVAVLTARDLGHEAFFGALQDRLRSLDAVSSLKALPTAFAPIMKMRVHGVPVDLGLANLRLERLPQRWDMFDDERNLADIDYKSLLALGGPRNNELLMRLVPNPYTFRSVLRVLRYWARRRGVYSSALGYFGGITWAIIAARACREAPPTASPAAILAELFRRMSKHRWPVPVLLGDIMRRDDFGFRVWGDRGPTGVAPVITPAYPAFNSTHSVTEANLATIQREFNRAAGIAMAMAAAAARGARAAALGQCAELCKARDFFGKFRHFLTVRVSASTESARSHWLGVLESKMRLLVSWIESHNAVRVCQLWPDHFRVSGGVDAYFIGFKLRRGVRSLNIRGTVRDFLDVINGMSFGISDGNVNMQHVKRANIPESVRNAQQGLVEDTQEQPEPAPAVATVPSEPKGQAKPSVAESSEEKIDSAGAKNGAAQQPPPRLTRVVRKRRREEPPMPDESLVSSSSTAAPKDVVSQQPSDDSQTDAKTEAKTEAKTDAKTDAKTAVTTLATTAKPSADVKPGPPSKRKGANAPRKKRRTIDLTDPDEFPSLGAATTSGSQGRRGAGRAGATAANAAKTRRGRPPRKTRRKR